MTKLETVKNLPDAKAKHATGEQIAQLQTQLKELKEQIAALPMAISELAVTVLPLAQAMNGMIPLLKLLQSMDERLQAIESVLPKDPNGRLMPLTSAVMSVKAANTANTLKDSDG